ncbi:hypothetical protein AB0D04_12205 [Streptomyces sp. NPDC048483]|uniref:hypothetical protein n=1 Tax=Streptomyces sp. NPDC048483 TaxID=3154927 RepID=UPI0034477083
MTVPHARLWFLPTSLAVLMAEVCADGQAAPPWAVPPPSPARPYADGRPYAEADRGPAAPADRP